MLLDCVVGRRSMTFTASFFYPCQNHYLITYHTNLFQDFAWDLTKVELKPSEERRCFLTDFLKKAGSF